MPKNTRQTYKQELERAEGNIDWAITHLMRMAEEYRPNHEEVSEVCELASAGLVAIQDLIKVLRGMI